MFACPNFGFCGEDGATNTHLLKYPNLKVCIADSLHSNDISCDFTIGGVDQIEYVDGFRITDDPFYGRQLVPFEVEHDVMGQIRPSLFLKKFGIKSDCGIQVIGRSLLQCPLHDALFREELHYVVRTVVRFKNQDNSRSIISN